MDEIVKQKIIFEITQLDEHISKSSILIKKCRLQEPDYIEMCAVGSILQSYYNGIENILLLVSKNIDNINFNSQKWHTELLMAMCAPSQKRVSLFSSKIKEQLVDYMNFRHFFRHSYGYCMKWEKVSALFINLENNWNEAKKEIQKFIRTV